MCESVTTNNEESMTNTNCRHESFNRKTGLCNKCGENVVKKDVPATTPALRLPDPTGQLPWTANREGSIDDLVEGLLGE